MEKRKQNQQKHEFAVYHPIDFAELMPDVGTDMMLEDDALSRRLQKVLRLREGDSFVLFDRFAHATVTIDSFGKKSVTIRVVSITPNVIYQPEIMFLLPLLKKDALEAAIYYLVETGVTTIQPLHTSKEHGRWRGGNDRERLERIAIAAAEQSKNFSIPEIREPITFAQLEDVLPKDSLRLFGDPSGRPIESFMRSQVPSHIVLACGPEGDFTHDEKETLVAASFEPLRLTPTILRAETAALGMSCLLRSVFS